MTSNCSDVPFLCFVSMLDSALISSIIGGVSAAAAIPGVAAGVGALATGAAGAIGANLANKAMNPTPQVRYKSGRKLGRVRRVIYRRRR